MDSTGYEWQVRKYNEWHNAVSTVLAANASHGNRSPMVEDSKNAVAQLPSQANQIADDGTKSYPSPPPSFANSPPTGILGGFLDKREGAPDKNLSDSHRSDENVVAQLPSQANQIA